MQTNPKVNFFFNKATQWKEEYALLRKTILGTGLVEELKWGVPCYQLDGKNVVLIHGFKEYCAILFHKGALMRDPENLLIQQTENVQSARQMRFTSADEIADLTPVLKNYVKEAIRVEKSGAKVELKKTEDYKVPEEFQVRLDADANLKAAFEALTPGRQRAYLFHFSQPKMPKTREARVDKYIPQILDGKGIDD